jgi:serine/threonine-protein kinase
MGEVYLADHPRLPKRIALKVLPGDVSADEEFRRRFEREADLASKLWHPNIVGVHDRGEFNGQLWISMDYVDGLDAARLLTKSHRSGMPVELVVKIVTAVAGALDYAHGQGLLHRDVKPANIMLTRPNGSGEQRVLLTDFGIARSIDDISGLTATNMTVGTVAYSAPGQLMGKPVDGRADQYALAATAYHLLTGTYLFPHSNPAVVISHHLTAQPPALADTMPGLARLDPVLAVALAKDPDDRFYSCSDFTTALTEQAATDGAVSPVALTRPATTQPKSTPRPFASPTSDESPKDPAENPSKPRIGAISLATITLIVAAVVVGGVVAWTHLSPNNQPAASEPTTTRTPAPELASPVTTSVSAPPPVFVPVDPPAPPTVTTSVPPLATPEARIAEPMICSLHYQYPQMQPVDLALSLLDRGIYRDYDEASLVVRLVLQDGCHGI